MLDETSLTSLGRTLCICRLTAKEDCRRKSSRVIMVGTMSRSLQGLEKLEDSVKLRDCYGRV